MIFKRSYNISEIVMNKEFSSDVFKHSICLISPVDGSRLPVNLTWSFDYLKCDEFTHIFV